MFYLIVKVVWVYFFGYKEVVIYRRIGILVYSFIEINVDVLEKI